MSRARLWTGLAVLGAVHAAVLLAGFLAPYDPLEQHRDYPFAAPARPRWADLRFLVRDGRGSLHLFGTREPACVFLLGTDAFGRDQFSRLLHGGRISLAAGLLAAALSLGSGWLLGAMAGFYGKWVDAAIMRAAELFLALPWLYLLLAVRAFLPLEMPPGRAFLVIVAVIGLVGWAWPARLVRGVVLSARERGYVTAARGFGASEGWLLRRHVLPQTAGVVVTQASLLAPRYVMAEITLSFLGLGVGEPAPSWGNMLANLQHYDVLVNYWWMASPAIIIIPVFMSYFLIADGLLRHSKSATL